MRALPFSPPARCGRAADQCTAQPVATWRCNVALQHCNRCVATAALQRAAKRCNRPAQGCNRNRWVATAAWMATCSVRVGDLRGPGRSVLASERAGGAVPWQVGTHMGTLSTPTELPTKGTWSLDTLTLTHSHKQTETHTNTHARARAHTHTHTHTRRQTQ